MSIRFKAISCLGSRKVRPKGKKAVGACAVENYLDKDAVSEEADVADDEGADVFVELLRDAFVLHQEVLAEGGTGELHLQLAVAHEDLSGIAADGFAHDFGPRLRDAVLQQGGLQAFFAQESQQDIAHYGKLFVYHFII